MHILDDPTGLSDRAPELLARTGWREPESGPRIATDFLRVPMELVIRREAFAARFGVASWSPWRGSASILNRGGLAGRLGLAEVPEASGPCARWFLGEDVAIRDALSYPSEGPRAHHVGMWARDERGLRRLEVAILFSSP